MGNRTLFITVNKEVLLYVSDCGRRGSTPFRTLCHSQSETVGGAYTFSITILGELVS